MTQEDKELLLKDLCARLPYGVKVEIISYGQETLKPWFGKLSCKDLDCFIHDIAYESIKPYLRQMSSMTEDEKIELKQISNDYLDEWENTKTSLERWKLDAKVSYKRAVFYNSHHIDWNGLIEKNLALDCTGLHIYD